MATQDLIHSISLVAGADLSAKQFFFVKLDSSGDAVLGAAETDKVIGVVQNDPGSAQAATVSVLGITKVVLGGTVAIADEITCDAAGKAIVSTTAGHRMLGQALRAGVAGDIVEILMLGPWDQHA